MSTNRSLYWRIGLLLLFVAVAPWIAVRLRRVAFFNNDFRDDAAMYAGHESGAQVVRALHVFRNTLPNHDSEGHACAPAGDTDGDGHADLFVCAAAADGAGGGTVALRSGATGEVLDRWLLPDNEHGPHGLRALGDLDGDGTQELLVQQSSVHGYGGRTLAFVVDGASGRVLIDVFAELPEVSSWNVAVEPVADFDGDGLMDLAIFGDQEPRIVSSQGAAAAPPIHLPAGTLNVGATLGTEAHAFVVERDGVWSRIAQTGQVLTRETLAELQLAQDEQQAPPPVPVTHLPAVGSLPIISAVFPATTVVQVPGATLAEVADVDGDGLGEVALGAPWMLNGGTVWVRSSTGTTLATLSIAAPTARLGATLLAWGSDALLIGAPGASLVLLVSTADGSVQRTLRGDSASGGFGLALANAGDVDGDGTDDLIVEEPWTSGTDSAGNPWRGTVWVLSGADLR